MQFPVIHLNGSDGPTLRDQYLEASKAAQDALNAMARIDVHGRDYYVVPHGDATSKAYREHRVRMVKLQSVQAELLAIAEDIQAQLDRKGVTR